MRSRTSPWVSTLLLSRPLTYRSRVVRRTYRIAALSVVSLSASVAGGYAATSLFTSRGITCVSEDAPGSAGVRCRRSDGRGYEVDVSSRGVTVVLNGAVLFFRPQPRNGRRWGSWP